MHMYVHVCVLQKATSHMRIAVVHNPQQSTIDWTSGEQKLDVFAAYEAALTAMDMGMAKSFVTKLVKEDNVEAIDLGEKTLDELAVHVSMLNWLYILMSYCLFVYFLVACAYHRPNEFC